LTGIDEERVTISYDATYRDVAGVGLGRGENVSSEPAN
jgi:hypothetical protein